MKKKLAVLLMSLGVLLIAAAAGVLVYNSYENKKAEEGSDIIVQSIRGYIEEKSLQDVVIDPFDEEMTVREIDGYGYIGYISVPKLEMDLPVMAECDNDRLKISPCRYYGSTKTDNLVIAAHNYKVHFGYLGNLKAGDLVIFTDMDAEVHKYIVNDVELLMPTDVDKVKDTGDDLILYTCNYGGTKRVVVRCSYV